MEADGTEREGEVVGVMQRHLVDQSSYFFFRVRVTLGKVLNLAILQAE